ncbi:expressed unknown protein [Seminavis robusta]|uniref:Uncharacterized protein n=1 Tax=Seminavis robusta TaxID=568900 RepID=A0A9N8DKA4_9STRA|nr:expressed unknown protein [Seminavis robusta]|eukprot:Sro190_g081940.1 n/a (463) ;mRNA; f:72349-73902
MSTNDGNNNDFFDAEETDPQKLDEDHDEVVDEDNAGEKRKASAGKQPRAQKKIRVSNARGLPWEIQRALAMEIEAMGGMDIFKKTTHGMSTICDRNPAVFGLPGSRRRHQIRSKVKYWRTYTPGEYKALINSFVERGGTNASTNSALLLQQRNNMNMQYQMHQQATMQMNPDCFPTKARTSQPSDIFPVAKQPKGKAQQQQGQNAFPKAPPYFGNNQPPPPQQQQSPTPQFQHNVAQQQFASEEKPAEKRKLSLPISDEQKYEVIQVDTKFPENNCGIGIFEFADAENGGYLHNGYEITMEGDVRDLVADAYKATLVGERDILLRVPAMSYSFLHNHEEFQKRAKSNDLYCPSTEEAREQARKRILKDPSRQDRFILLEFPEGVKLTNKIFSPESTDGEIDFDLMPITIDVELNGKELPMTITRISWRVTTEARKRRPVRKDKSEEAGGATTKGASKLANLF